MAPKTDRLQLRTPFGKLNDCIISDWNRGKKIDICHFWEVFSKSHDSGVSHLFHMRKIEMAHTWAVSGKSPDDSVGELYLAVPNNRGRLWKIFTDKLPLW